MPNSQKTVSKGHAQGPYMAARAGVEPTTLRHHVAQHLISITETLTQDKIIKIKIPFQVKRQTK